jgi:hypothetical protein
MLQWARLEKECRWTERTCVKAALKRADLPMLKWLRSCMPHEALEKAVRFHMAQAAGLDVVGCIRAVAWLQSAELIDLTDEQQREDLSNAAIASGYVHTLQWLRSKEEFPIPWEGESLYPSTVAARKGHYDMIKYLYVYEVDMRKEAVGSGNLQLVGYLVQQGIDSWRPEYDRQPDQYMPDCLTIAAAQVRI